MRLTLPHSSDAETRSALSRISEALRSVPKFAIVDGVTPGAANTAFTVKHGLGITPQSFFWRADADLNLYANATDRRAWDADYITIKGTAASTAFTLVVMGDL